MNNFLVRNTVLDFHLIKNLNLKRSSWSLDNSFMLSDVLKNKDKGEKMKGIIKVLLIK